MTHLDSTYRVQNGCHNCKHVFSQQDYDAHPEYWCTRNAPPRPKTGATMVTGEQWGVPYPKVFDPELGYERNAELSPEDHAAWAAEDDRVQEEQVEAWEAWHPGREVRPCGRCNHWEGKDWS